MGSRKLNSKKTRFLWCVRSVSLFKTWGFQEASTGTFIAYFSSSDFTPWLVPSSCLESLEMIESLSRSLHRRLVKISFPATYFKFQLPRPGGMDFVLETTYNISDHNRWYGQYLRSIGKRINIALLHRHRPVPSKGRIYH